ncbi:alcohol acyltransferase 9-like [Nymphaea colorata]|nr:alcohol acyltransferase 9-like [Nymphaea colorata]
MPNYEELPECQLLSPPLLVPPLSATPNLVLYLSNLDDHRFIRFSVKYLFLFRAPSPPEVPAIRSSLSSLLVHYHPLAGRLRRSPADDAKLEIVCSGEGALFSEGFMDISADAFLRAAKSPNRSWRQLLYRIPGHDFLSTPPLVIQATHLNCGGMLLCVGMNHCVCDGIGSAQFLRAWAEMCRHPDAPLSVQPCWGREALRPRLPLKIQFPHPEFAQPDPDPCPEDRPPAAAAEPLVPVSITFGADRILQLKRLCMPLLKCTSFEVLAAHVWRCWARAMARKTVKLLFTADVRSRLDPPLPAGYYGNGFVLACAECNPEVLGHESICGAVKAVQSAKAAALSDAHVRSVVDLLEERRPMVDLGSSLVVTQWSRLGLERVDFGTGLPAHVGPISSEVHCIFLPVVGQPEAVTILVSMPESRAHKFECYLRDLADKEVEGPLGVIPNYQLTPVRS